MKIFDLGYMPQTAADKLVDGLHGKSYMNFNVIYRTDPGGTHVDLGTNYNDTPEEILTLALHIMAQH